MALRQLHTAETMFIDDGITDGANFPPSSDAVYDALANAGGGSTGGAVLMVHGNFDETTGDVSLDKTWQEIYDAVEADKIVALKITQSAQEENYDVCEVGYLSGVTSISQYCVRFWYNEEFVYFVANNPNEYLVLTNGDAQQI